MASHFKPPTQKRFRIPEIQMVHFDLFCQISWMESWGRWLSHRHFKVYFLIFFFFLNLSNFPNFRETDGNLFVLSFEGAIDIKWSKVALDLSKAAKRGSTFKTSKQCRERWLNHLNPFLNKYVIKFLILLKFIIFLTFSWKIYNFIIIRSF